MPRKIEHRSGNQYQGLAVHRGTISYLALFSRAVRFYQSPHQSNPETLLVRSNRERHISAWNAAEFGR